MKEFDYLIVGTGLYGAAFAREALKRGGRVMMSGAPRACGRQCLYTEWSQAFRCTATARIFHTNDARIWRYVAPSSRR